MENTTHIVVAHGKRFASPEFEQSPAMPTRVDIEPTMQIAVAESSKICVRLALGSLLRLQFHSATVSRCRMLTAETIHRDLEADHRSGMTTVLFHQYAIRYDSTGNRRSCIVHTTPEYGVFHSQYPVVVVNRFLPARIAMHQRQLICLQTATHANCCRQAPSYRFVRA